MDFKQAEALIVQVSDLHFGREICPPALAVPGMFPHSVDALVELENEIRAVMLRYPNAAKSLRSSVT